MIVHVAKAGRDMPGLLRYLYGPGRSDEHTDQRMIAGSAGLEYAFTGALKPSEAGELGRFIEATWREDDDEIRQLTPVGGTSARSGTTAGAGDVGVGGGGVGVVDQPTAAAAERGHVYHLIVSLPPGAHWRDEDWATIAHDVVDGMGFTSAPHAAPETSPDPARTSGASSSTVDAGASTRDRTGGRAGEQLGESAGGCRWVAVAHGRSTGGNEHLHIAVNLVRQDGRRASIFGDFRRLARIREQIEQTRPWVAPLHDRGLTPQRSLPGYTHVEHQVVRDAERAATHDPSTSTPTPTPTTPTTTSTGDGAVVHDRVFLQQVVRAAAVAAATEGEWLQRVVDVDGVQIEAARWAPGGRDEVTGYRVRRDEGRWYTASQLAPDLTLGRLRPRWAAHEDQDTSRAALALWREDTSPDLSPVPATADEDLQAAAAHLDAWRVELRQLDPHDREPWTRAATDVAGVTAALSRTPGPHQTALAGAGQDLTRQALLTPLPTRPTSSGAPPAGAPQADAVRGGVAVPTVRTGPSNAQLAARHLQAALRVSAPGGHRGWDVVLRQIGHVLAAVEDAQTARGELVTAHRLAATRAALTRLPGPQRSDSDPTHPLDPEAQRARDVTRRLSVEATPIEQRTWSGTTTDTPHGTGPGVDQRRTSGRPGPQTPGAHR